MAPKGILFGAKSIVKLYLLSNLFDFTRFRINFSIRITGAPFLMTRFRSIIIKPNSVRNINYIKNIFFATAVVKMSF